MTTQKPPIPKSGAGDVRARQHDLGHHSNEILEAVDELRAMEQQKRSEDISTPPFHELADAIKDKSREIFRIADEQRQLGETIPTTDESIDGIERTG
jgi:hypothetical protein